MVEKHLSEIRSREEDAGRRLREAEGRAAGIIDTAREDGEQRLKQVRAEAAEHERALLAEARTRADRAIAEIRADNERYLSALEREAKKNEETALRIIIDSFQAKE
jgi:vacuolar-type H+-ATPase subunit H